MSKMSNYLENALINATLRATAYTAPQTVYVALYTTDPTDADSGTEVSGGGYVRQSVTFNPPANGSASNAADITFPIASANWGTITHIGLRDSSAGGNLLYHAPLTVQQTVNSGMQMVFPSGQIVVTLD